MSKKYCVYGPDLYAEGYTMGVHITVEAFSLALLQEFEKMGADQQNIMTLRELINKKRAELLRPESEKK